MVKIALIRPGATDYDLQGRIQGSLDMPLSAVGEREVQELIPRLQALHLEVLYSSPGEPSWQTAELLAEALDVRLKKLDQLGNLNLGLWQGMLVDEVKHKQPTVYRQWLDQPESICPPDGETLGEAFERVETAVAKILKKNKTGTTVGLIVPEPLASLVRAHLSGGDIGDLWHASGIEHGHYELIVPNLDGTLPELTPPGSVTIK